MKILMISLHADLTVPAGIEEGGGTHSYIRELLTFFSDKSHKITLITRKCHPDLPEHEIISPGCIIRRIIINGETPIDKKLLYSFHEITLEKVKAVLNEISFIPDLIHSIYWNSGQVAMELSQQLKIPFVHTVISNGLRREQVGMKEIIKQRFDIEKKIFDNACYIFCITSSEKEDLVQLYHTCPEKIVIPGRPVSNDLLYPAHDDFGQPYLYHINNKNISDKSTTKLNCNFFYSDIQKNTWWIKNAFIYCGRIAVNKGVDIIIRAWLTLKERFAEKCPPLWIVGGALTEIEQFKAKLDICDALKDYENSNQLIWWGFLDQRGISTLLLKSQALIMHSSYEPGGRVVIEALSSGVPVIATPNGFGADYIHDWFNGFKVKYSDVNSLCHTMSLFIKQPYLSNCLGINARKYMEKVLENWDFSGLHQKIYNAAFSHLRIVCKDNTMQMAGIVQRKNYINVYPFFNDVISINELNTLVKKAANESVEIKECNANVSMALWTFESSNGLYEIEQPYTRLLETAFYNSTTYSIVDCRASIYNREKYYADLVCTNSVTYFFDDYYVLIKKSLSDLNYHNIENATAINKLKHLFYTFADNRYLSEINENMMYYNCDWQYCTFEEILDGLKYYQSIIPSMLCDIYLFSLGFSTRALHYMIHDKRNNIPEHIIKLFTECEPYLYQTAQIKPRYGTCLDDCSINNIGRDTSRDQYFFRNCISIYWGDTAKMPSSFVYDYILNLVIHEKQIVSIKNILYQYASSDKFKLSVGWLFLICFENIIKYIVKMQNQQYEYSYMILEKLISEFIF